MKVRSSVKPICESETQTGTRLIPVIFSRKGVLVLVYYERLQIRSFSDCGEKTDII